MTLPQDINDINVINWLITNTKKSNIEWQREENPNDFGNFYGECYADFNDGNNKVRVTFNTGSWRFIQEMKVILSSSGQHKITICQPQPKGFFRNKYNSENDAELAKAINKLAALALDQHTQRHEKYKANEETRRQVIFRRLMFGDKL